MAKETINTGTTSNDGTGDTLKQAAIKINNNFTELYDANSAATLVDGANISWDLDSAANATVTLAGNRTLDNPTNITAGGRYSLLVKQDATGSRTLAYGAAYKWEGGVAPTLTTDSSGEDLLEFVSPDGVNMYGKSFLDFS